MDDVFRWWCLGVFTLPLPEQLVGGGQDGALRCPRAPAMQKRWSPNWTGLTGVRGGLAEVRVPSIRVCATPRSQSEACW